MTQHTTYPIVLHHGLLGMGNFKVGGIHVSYFHKIDRALANLGHPILPTRVHPTGSIQARATQLKAAICSFLDRQANPDQKLIIIAHSMGGLDSRYMITHLGMHQHVAALLTVATPHRGSSYADWVVDHIGKPLRIAALARKIHLDIRAFTDLTRSACQQFNEQTPDHPDVAYFSVSTARPWPMVPPWLLHAHRVLSEREGDNDGLVSVTSAIWGHHLGTWAADHFHSINRRYIIEKRENRTGDIRAHYVDALNHVLQHLAQKNGQTLSTVAENELVAER